LFANTYDSTNCVEKSTYVISLIESHSDPSRAFDAGSYTPSNWVRSSCSFCHVQSINKTYNLSYPSVAIVLNHLAASLTWLNFKQSVDRKDKQQ